MKIEITNVWFQEPENRVGATVFFGGTEADSNPETGGIFSAKVTVFVRPVESVQELKTSIVEAARGFLRRCLEG